MNQQNFRRNSLADCSSRLLLQQLLLPANRINRPVAAAVAAYFFVLQRLSSMSGRCSLGRLPVVAQLTTSIIHTDFDRPVDAY
jgi:hypothetical protein